MFLGAICANTNAYANAAAANATDVVTPLLDADSEEEVVDTNFLKLFGEWQSLEESSGRVSTTIYRPGTVSIPSRNPLNNMTMTSGYGMRNHPILGGRRQHAGVDLAAPMGTPVYATADGIVSRADRFSSYGLFIAIEHGGDLQTRYAHLSGINVAEGQNVRKGDLIGYVGSTGRSTGPHLHYEVRVDGQPANPAAYMHGDH